MKKRIFVFGAMFLVSLICSNMFFNYFAQAGNDVVATVNGQELTRSDLADLLIGTYGREGLELLVKRTLVRQEAKKQKISLTNEDIEKRMELMIEGEMKRQMKKGGLKDEDELERELEKNGSTLEEFKKSIIAAFKLARGQIESELLAEKIIKKNVKVSNDELHEAYEQQFGEKILARQIVKRSKRDAEKILNRIKAGADFGALAKKESIDRNSAARGGKMRPFGPHGTIGKAVANLKKGDVSEIIKTDRNYHILKIDNRVPRSMKKFSEVKDNLTKFVTAMKVRNRVNPWILHLVESSDITTNLK